MRLQNVAAIKREKERVEQILYAAALSLIESKARHILLTHADLDEFVMAMGGWLFTRKNSEDSISTVDREYIPAYAKSFTRMMDEFDDMDLKVTGEAMRFTSRGPVVQGWGVCDGLDGAAVATKYGNAAA